MTRFGPPERFQSWGRIDPFEGPVARPRFAGDLAEILADPARPQSVLAVGCGRSYGDSNLNHGGGLIAMRGLDRFLQVDRKALVLRAQAGVTIAEALQFLTPQGLFLPVLPGTQHVTLGGAVANDVHGKNHPAAGSFGRWVRRMGLVRSDIGERQIAPGDADGLFAATIGGLGLTGLITWVELQLVPIDSTDLRVEDAPFETLDEYYQLMLDHADADYRVAWIDCTAPGRGIFSCASHQKIGESAPPQTRTRFAMPFDAPGVLFNGLTLRAFNAAYKMRRRRGPRREHFSRFHFPLDSIADWNRLYGKHGFRQYQCVLPHREAREGAMEILRTIKKAGDGSFLAVLKNFGALPSPGLLSFPMEGATLAIDLRNREARSLALLSRLDEIVLHAGGRVYPAKDGRITARNFQLMYPQWRDLERARDPAIRSAFWKRVTS